MDKLLEHIDKQIMFNQDKNILADNIDMFQFSNETIKSIPNIDRLSSAAKLLLINYTADKTIEAFCRANQYYTFDTKNKNDLRKIYSDLFESLRHSTVPVEIVSKKHYDKLKRWLKNSNPFAAKIYNNGDKTISPVACSEYSKDLQVNLLKIDIRDIKQPVLDIGCGKNGYLVNDLANQNINVCGIDRFQYNNPHFEKANWLEYKYGTKKWGTVISHSGFSNHFNHHHLREDGIYITYAKTYMNILHSLKKGGRFHYAPDLPFIEKYLDNRQFSIEKHGINQFDFKAAIITRLK